MPKKKRKVIQRDKKSGFTAMPAFEKAGLKLRDDTRFIRALMLIALLGPLLLKFVLSAMLLIIVFKGCFSAVPVLSLATWGWIRKLFDMVK